MLKLITSFLLSVIITYLIEYQPNSTILNSIYTVSGILFSIGLGLIISFMPNGVKNRRYLAELRFTVNRIRNKFFLEFGIATLLFVVFPLIEKLPVINIYWIKLNFSLFFEVQILSSIPYLIINFLAIQKLNNDLFDRVNSKS